MHILYTITDGKYGGAQSHVAQLLRDMKVRGYTLSLVSAHSEGWLIAEAKKLGVQVYTNPYISNSFNPFSALRAYRLLKKQIKAISPDIIHCHSSYASAYTRAVVRKHIPTIYTAHGWGFNIGMPALKRTVALTMEAVLKRYTSTFICVANFVKELGMRYGIVSDETAMVIYNGIEQTNDGDVSRSGAPYEVLFIGRLAAPKRPDLLVEAYQLLDSGVQAQLRISIIGDGPQRSALETQIKQAECEDNIVLRGALLRDEVFGTLRRAHALAFLSDWEAFPMTILEAVASGIPVISSNVGGISEILTLTQDTLVENTPEAVAAAITSFVDRASGMSWSEKSRHNTEILEQQFSLSHMLEQVHDVYKQTQQAQ